MTARLRRLPTRPLFEATRAETNNQLAEMLGISRKAVAAAARRGLTVWKADEWAVRAGLHPSNVWSEEFYDNLYESDSEEETDGSG